jgi:NADH:ubiquinone reductase (H+-translocating)
VSRIEARDRPERKRIVVVGGGFAGLHVARDLRRARADVLLIDRTNHHLFQPLLYQVATAALSPGEIAVPIRSVLRRQKNVRVIMGEVTGLDPDADRIRLAGGSTVDFDYLVLATGARHAYFGNDQWAPIAPGLKTIPDALRIRERIMRSLEVAECLEDPAARAPHLCFVVVGGGPTGVEMAGAIAEIAKMAMIRDFRTIGRDDPRVILVEAAPTILGGYPAPLPEKAVRQLEELGVSVRTGCRVEDVREDGVETSEGFIAARNVIWAAGNRVDTPAASVDAPTDRSGRVKVAPDLSLPGRPNVFVVGDAAFVADAEGRPVPAVAPAAVQQGRFVARLLRAELAGEAKRPAFRYVDKGSMATIGRYRAVARIGRMRMSGFAAWVLWLLVHILTLIGFRNRFRVVAEWAWYYVSLRAGYRLVTGLDDGGDPSEPDGERPDSTAADAPRRSAS